MRHYGTRAAHLGTSVTYQKSQHTRRWSHAIISKSSSTNIINVTQGKGIGPTYGFATSLEVGPGATLGTLQTRYPYAQDLKDQPHGSRPAPSTREG
jgi:hypothetical protein